MVRVQKKWENSSIAHMWSKISGLHKALIDLPMTILLKQIHFLETFFSTFDNFWKKTPITFSEKSQASSDMQAFIHSFNIMQNTNVLEFSVSASKVRMISILQRER